MAMRDSEEGEFDADVGEMLGYWKFDDHGAKCFADFGGAGQCLYHDCDYHDCDEATARWAVERLGPERFGDTTVTPVSVPRFWAADLPRSFIRCLQRHHDEPYRPLGPRLNGARARAADQM